MSVLSCENVTKKFGDDVVLDGVDVTVDEHQVVALIGASGSGKSTLLRCINLLETVDDGVITLDGRDITDPRVDPDEVRRRIGVVFQAYNLFPHMSVLDNATLAPRVVHGRSREETEEKARALLRRVGLEEKAREYPDRLSGGQQQRSCVHLPTIRGYCRWTRCPVPSIRSCSARCSGSSATSPSRA